MTELGRFSDSWIDRGGGGGIGSKIKETLERNDEGDLKAKVDEAYRSLKKQINDIDTARTRLLSKDSLYYEKIVDALKKDQRNRAIVYANEIAELRKVIKSIHHTKLALEQLSVRLSTVRDVGDIVSTLAPATRLLQTLRKDVSFVLPHADKQMDELSDMLNTTLVEAGQMSGVSVDFSVANAEAEKILRDAEVQVEGELEEQLPSVPVSDSKEGVLA